MKFIVFAAIIAFAAFAAMPVDAASEMECTMCQFLAQEVETYITNNNTEHEIVTKMDDLCNKLSTKFSGTCKDIVDNYLVTIIEAVVARETPDVICQQIKICPAPSSSKAATIPVAKVEGGEYCAICEFVMSKLEDLISSQSTQQEIIAALDKVCDLLPKSVSGECESLVNTYGPQILQLLLQKEPPKTVCTQLGLCKNSSSLRVEPARVQGGAYCAICEFVMSKLEEVLSNNSTEQEIIAAVEKVCGFLPKTVASECDSLVSTYGPEIIQLLLQKEPPQTVCTQLGLCHSKARTLPIGPEKKQHKRTEPVGPEKVMGGAECALCEFVMSKLEDLVGENSTQQEIIAALDKVCGYLPKTIQKDCQELINTYGPQILQLLLQKEPPQTICSQIGLCKNSSEVVVRGMAGPKIVSKKESLKGGAYCAICEFVMSKLEEVLSNNSTEQEIIAAVEKVCGFLPKTVASECDSLVSTYGPQIIQLLLQKEPPQTVCTQLGLCKSSQTARVGASVSAGGECALCEFVMSKLEDLLTENSTETAILNALEKVCGFLPSSLSGECDALIQQYGPQMFQLFVQKEPPKVICTQLGICKSNVVKSVPLRGSRKPAHTHHYF